MPDEPTPVFLKVLVVDDEANVRKTLSSCLRGDGHTVVAVADGRDAASEAARQPFDLAFIDLRLGGELGIDLIPELLARNAKTQIIIITGHASIDSAVETINRGAVDYITKPFSPAQIRLALGRVLQLRSLQQKVAQLEENAVEPISSPVLESASSSMQRIIGLCLEFAHSDTTVLLRGESGTGKGVLSRAIHSWSDRHARPFGTVSCPTLSPQLLESELFGHAKGAFTGAFKDHAGRIAACDGGTFFLDEIGDLPLDLQPKLLRFVQDREYERIGDPVTYRADVRILAATNVNLEEAVRNGRFREDLLYRVKVVQLDLPPLRDRREDIVQLAENFLAELRRGRPILGFMDDALAALRSYHWPGNIRELRNIIERAVILCRGARIGIEHFPGSITPSATPPELGDPISLAELKELHMRRILARSKSLDEAALVLGIDLATLWRRRKRYQI